MRNYNPANYLLTLCLGTVLNYSVYASGNGSDEPGFVAPPATRSPPPAPPRSVSSGENNNPCCCCPVTSQARTEAKKPPQPPVLITKLKSETSPSGLEKKVDKK
jgi:hypothetical protein